MTVERYVRERTKYVPEEAGSPCTARNGVLVS